MALEVRKAVHGSDHYTIGDGPPFRGVAKRLDDAILFAAAQDLLTVLQRIVADDRAALDHDDYAAARAAIAAAYHAPSNG